MNNIVISMVENDSIAQEAGIEKGDVLLTINGKKVEDVFDYRFYIANEELLLEVEKKNGDILEIEIIKDEYEDIGIEFEDPLMDEAKSCTNKCIFCFIDQLPAGMRDTVYFKDDDSRLSFLSGNYVTLTNMKDSDIDRIIRYRMSPINISVHTTNPDLRVKMLGNRFSRDIMERLKRLYDGNIDMNCQIVLCKGINDMNELDRSLKELSSLCHYVKSISVVPVGLTKYRQNLTELEPYDKKSSANVIEQVEKWQNDFFKSLGTRLVYLADEFYIMAEKRIPSYKHYEDFPQIENGVGLIALLDYEFKKQLRKIKGFQINGSERHVSIATGVSSYKYIKKMADTLMSKVDNLKVTVYSIRNDFFGESVTVTGLLTGRDLLAQLKDKDLGEGLLICKSMLRSGEELFLDDYTICDIEESLKIKVIPVENDGIDFVNKLLGLE